MQWPGGAGGADRGQRFPSASRRRAAATRTITSSWFLLFGSLYLVTAERAGELGTVLTYVAWAIGHLGYDVALPLLAASLVPFLAAPMRYSMLASQGSGEALETVLTSNKFLLGAGRLWLATIGTALYLD